MKKRNNRPGRPSSKAGGKGRRKQLSVVGSRGRQRFLRGMITHDLVQRGLGFDDAFAAASAIRDVLADREEVTTTEIRDLIDARLERMFGSDAPERFRGAPEKPDLEVSDQGQRQPFSRGLLARSMSAAGLNLDQAYRLVTELEGELRADGAALSATDDIARRAGDLLERSHGVEVARRYRLVRRLHRLSRPLVVYVGGASGTGKSTLAIELAPLLRIYRINATDTIRQVMRMVFTPAILPALHSSSFEIAPSYESGTVAGGRPRGRGQRMRLIRSFEEQATRVCVGVRAVVERAIAENMSIVVEGVHLHPAIVPFPDLEGAAYQLPLVLATLNVETHRPRFLTRARVGGRSADRYFESFESIRVIHDYLLQQAESHERPMIDTSEGEPPVDRTLRLITGILQQRFPRIAKHGWGETRPAAPTLLLFLDGLADRPVRALGGRTPLQAAETPTLDRLAREGRCGLADPVGPGIVPDTASGTLAIFGQSPLALRRGPVEAIGAGLRLKAGDVALRGNFATLDDKGNVVDRRAGRIREGADELAAALDRLPLPEGRADGVVVRVSTGTEHRLAIVIRGQGLSSAIHGSDPGDGAPPSPPLVPRSIEPDDDAALRTAKIVELFEQEARRVLAKHPVNRDRAKRGLPQAGIVLTRGAGRIHRLTPLEEQGEPLRLSCVSGDKTILGIAELVGGKARTAPEMTANLDTDLEAKFDAALAALGQDDLIVLHVKGADIASHDRRPDLKVSFLENVDRCLAALLAKHDGPLRISVASDHATLAEVGQHASDPVPVLIWGHGVPQDGVEVFDEQAAAAGALQRFPLQTLLGRLYDLS